MKELSVATVGSRSLSVGQTTIIVVAALLPLGFHALASLGIAQLGPRFLPMYYAPFIAAVWGRQSTAILLSLALPAANFLIFGYPPLTTQLIIAAEALTGSILLGFAARSGMAPRFSLLLLPLAYLVGKFVSSLTVVPLLLAESPIDFAVRSLQGGYPGLIVMSILGFATCRWKGE